MTTDEKLYELLKNQERIERKLNYIAIMLVGNQRFWDEWGKGKFIGHDSQGDVFQWRECGDWGKLNPVTVPE